MLNDKKVGSVKSCIWSKRGVLTSLVNLYFSALAWDFFSFSIYFFSVGVCGVWVFVRLRCSLFIRFPLLCFYSIYLVVAQPGPAQPSPAEHRQHQILDLGSFSRSQKVLYMTVQWNVVFLILMCFIKSRNLLNKNKKCSECYFLISDYFNY